MTTSLSTKQLLLLSFLIVLGAINSCAYTPAIPEISSYFHQSLQKTQFLIVTSLLAHCAAPLMFAAFANALSRFKSIYIGLLICLFGDLFSILSHSIHQFSLMILGIFLLSFGGNMGFSLSLTLIKEQTLEFLEKPLKLTALSFAIFPGLMITLSGTLLSFGSWPIIFISLAFYHLILLWGTYTLSTSFRNVSAPVKLLSLKPLLQKKFLMPIFASGCLTGITFTFSAFAPNIAIHTLGISSIAFGFWSNVPSLGMLIGSLLALYFSTQQFSTVKKIFGFCLLIALGFIFLNLVSETFSVSTLFFSMALMNIGIQLLYPFMTMRALIIKGNEAASSSAWISSIHFLIASQIVNLANHLPLSSILSLAVISGLCGGMTLFLI